MDDHTMSRADYMRLLAERNEFAARIEELERERDEDQGVIRVWRRRCEEAEARADRLAAQLKEAGEAVSDGTDALTHALYLLPGDANQRKGMEAALDRMSAALASMKEETDGRAVKGEGT